RFDDLREPFRRLQACNVGRLVPAEIVELFVQSRLTREPTAGEGKDDEMALDAGVVGSPDRLAISGQRDRLDLERGLFANLPLQRVEQCLARLDHPTWQRV